MNFCSARLNSDTSLSGFRHVIFTACENPIVLDRLREAHPQHPLITAELARRAACAGQHDQAAAAHATACRLLKSRLAASPDDSALAAALADVLLQPDPVAWIAVKPVTVTSKKGTTLTRLQDDSVLASGKNPSRETYVVLGETSARRVTAVRVEALPHDSLPGGGPGRRGRNAGAFCVGKMSVFRQAPDKAKSPVSLPQVIHTPTGPDNSTRHRWRPSAGGADHCVAVYDASERLELQDQERLEFQLPLINDQYFPASGNLGRFRILVADADEAFHLTAKRFVAQNQTDPWARLAAAWHVTGDVQALETLLAKRPEAAI